MEAGQIYVDHQFYPHPETGELLPKYFVVLAVDQYGDVVARLLTSRSTGRPIAPRCHHGDPYPGFYLGILCAALPKPSWLDLRALEEFDRAKLTGRMQNGIIELTHVLDADILAEALSCAAAADDTTIRQERAIRDQLALLTSKS